MTTTTLKFDGSKLKTLRRAARFTQPALAREVGKTAQDISNYENGYATPPADTLLSLQRILRVGYKAFAKETTTTL